MEFLREQYIEKLASRRNNGLVKVITGARRAGKSLMNIDSPYKIYFEDIGVRNARLNFRQTEETHIMENVLYNELRSRGFSVDVGQVDVSEMTGRQDKNGHDT